MITSMIAVPLEEKMGEPIEHVDSSGLSVANCAGHEDYLECRGSADARIAGASWEGEALPSLSVFG
jgi:hypothetical protein